MAAPILMDIRGVGSFSLPIPGTDPVKYVAAGTLAEIERATRRQDALQQIADFGQEQDAAPAAQPAPVAAGVVPAELMREAASMLRNSMFQFCDTSDKASDLADRISAVLASLAPVAAEPVRQVLLSQRESFEHWFSDEGKSPRAIERSGEGYKLAQAQSAWQAWKACYAALGITGRPSGTPVQDAPQVPTAAEVRAAALEEAAQAADEIEEGYMKQQGGKWPELRDDAETGARDCAAAIRALAAAPSVEVKGEQGEMGGGA